MLKSRTAFLAVALLCACIPLSVPAAPADPGHSDAAHVSAPAKASVAELAPFAPAAVEQLPAPKPFDVLLGLPDLAFGQSMADALIRSCLVEAKHESPSGNYVAFNRSLYGLPAKSRPWRPAKV